MTGSRVGFLAENQLMEEKYYKKIYGKNYEKKKKFIGLKLVDRPLLFANKRDKSDAMKTTQVKE